MIDISNLAAQLESLRTQLAQATSADERFELERRIAMIEAQLSTGSGGIITSDVSGTSIAIGHSSQSVARNVTTGGDYAEGSIDKRQGTFVEGDQFNIITEEQTYIVAGLKNPYLGLRAFTYEDRASFAGRERLVLETVATITAPGDQRTLLFVTGASGSGKSSFAQAGLLPMLAEFYEARNIEIRRAVIRPGPHPLAALADGLLQLNLPPNEEFAAARPFMVRVPSAAPTPTSVSLLVLDQFEELFSPQCDPAQRDALFAILAGLPTFSVSRMHLIATLRADFLPDLFEHRTLYDIAKQGVDLRVMRIEELQEAIQCPLQHAYPDKRFEVSLLRQLAADAAEDTAYLPLLQVTLEDLFRRGSLTPSTYSSLAEALRNRADTVQDCLDYDGERQRLRPAEEREIITAIFLDLVRVSLDDDAHRDVRRRQPLAALLRGDVAEQQQRLRLIRELCAARLLSASAEMPDEGAISTRDVEIDIIHESLITRWDRLRSAISEQRNALQQGERFGQALAEWKENARQLNADDYLLSGVRLAEADALNARDDVVFRQDDAQLFYKRSVQRRDAVRQRQLRRTQLIAAALGVLALIAVVTALFAANRQQMAEASSRRAERQTRITQARQLIATDLIVDKVFPERRLLLAAEALQSTMVDSITLHSAKALALATARETGSYAIPGAVYMAFSVDSRYLATSDGLSAARVWDVTRLPPSLIASVESGTPSGALAFDPSGRYLATYDDDHVVRLWTVGNWKTPSLVLPAHAQDSPIYIRGLIFTPDGHKLIGHGYDEVWIWDLTAPEREPTMPADFGEAGYPVLVSPGGRYLVSSAKDDVALLVWDLMRPEGPPIRMPQPQDIGRYEAYAFAANNHYLAGLSGRKLLIWDMSAPGSEPRRELIAEEHNAVTVGDVLMVSLDGRFVVTGSSDYGLSYLWSLDDGSVQSLGAYAVAFSPDGQFFVTGSPQGVVERWNLKAPVRTSGLRYGHEEAVDDVQFSPDSRLFATQGRDGVVRVWAWDMTPIDPISLPYGRPVAFVDGSILFAANSAIGRLIIRQGSNEVTDLLRLSNDRITSVSPDGSRMVAVDRDGLAWAWNLANLRQPPFALIGYVASRAATFSSDGRWFADWHGDGSIRLWDLLAPEQEPRTLLGSPGSIFSLAFSPDGRFLAASGWEAGVNLWNLSQPNPTLVRLKAPERNFKVIFSPDGRYLAVAGTVVQLWEISGSDPPRELLSETLGVYDIAFSHDSQSFTAGIRIGQIHRGYRHRGGALVWRLGKQVVSVGRFEGHGAPVRWVALSPDGRYLATSAIEDAQVLVWDTRDLQGEPIILPGGPQTLSFSPDGRYLAVGAKLWDATLWDDDPHDLIALTCAFAGRNLSTTEWQHYLGEELYHKTCPQLR